MKASNLLNTQVFFENDTRLRGLVRDIRVRDHKIDCLVLSEGGLFSKAQIIFPSDIIEVDYDHVTLGGDKAITKLSAKEMKARLEESYSLVNTPVKDVDGKRFAKVADATVSKDFKVQEYDLSRSFFDDLDYGYSLVDAEHMEYRDKSLNYDKDMLEMEQTHREGGILEKVLGEEHHENITG